jgi:hypothetical protein
MLHAGVCLIVLTGYKDKKNHLPFYAEIKNGNMNGTLLTDLADLIPMAIGRILFQ